MSQPASDTLLNPLIIIKIPTTNNDLVYFSNTQHLLDLVWIGTCAPAECRARMQLQGCCEGFQARLSSSRA